MTNNNIIISELENMNFFNIIDEQVIVIIDDNQNVIDVISEVFKHAIHQRVMICPFNSSNDAIYFILNFYSSIKVIICDHNLDNNKKGLEIVKLLKDKDIFIPFILISAHLSNFSLIEYKNMGISLYINKSDTKFFHKLTDLTSIFFLS